MSYDFYAYDPADPDRYTDPSFSDEHPAFGSDGMAGTVMVTERGYARCGNYTSNVSGMWTKCLTAALGAVPVAQQWADRDLMAMKERYPDHGYYAVREPSGRLRLRDLAGVRCGDLVPVLSAAVEWGVEHIDELREDNPDNGWGNAEGAVTYLWDIQRFCEMYPEWLLRISS